MSPPLALDSSLTSYILHSGIHVKTAIFQNVLREIWRATLLYAIFCIPRVSQRNVGTQKKQRSFSSALFRVSSLYLARCCGLRHTYLCMQDMPQRSPLFIFKSHWISQGNSILNSAVRCQQIFLHYESYETRRSSKRFEDRTTGTGIFGCYFVYVHCW